MKFLFTVFTSAILASFVTFLLVHLHFTGLLPWENESGQGVINATVQSKILEEAREVVVTLPRNYSTRKKYPVLYILDGGSLQDHHSVALEVLAANDYAPEAIVVGIPNPGMEARQRDLTPPYMMTESGDSTSAPGSGHKFLEFMRLELIPFIDRQYSTLNYRLLSGNSRGGLLVLHSLMATPDLFQARFCYSTPFWRQDEIILEKFSDYVHKTDSLNTFLFFSAGENETDNIKRGCNSLAERLRRKAPSGMRWNLQFTPGADHQSNARYSVGKALGLWGKYAGEQAIDLRMN
jgi:predicted alpha/beta superfamily hydrolase